MRLFVVATVLAVGVEAHQSTGGVQSPPITPRPVKNSEDLRSSELKAKLSALKAAAMTSSSQDVIALLTESFRDPSRHIREAACYVVIARAGGVRFRDTAEIRQQWVADRPSLFTLRERLFGLMASDDEAIVRQAALLALTNLEYDGGEKRSVGMRVSSLFVERLAAAYPLEPAALVRAEIIKSLSLADNNSPKRLETVDRSLSDPSADVLQVALLGIARSGGVVSPNKVAALLKHGDTRVRGASVQALASFGAGGKPFLPALKEALSAEQDETVRAALVGTIGLISRAK